MIYEIETLVFWFLPCPWVFDPSWEVGHNIKSCCQCDIAVQLFDTFLGSLCWLAIFSCHFHCRLIVFLSLTEPGSVVFLLLSLSYCRCFFLSSYINPALTLSNFVGATSACSSPIERSFPPNPTRFADPDDGVVSIFVGILPDSPAF